MAKNGVDRKKNKSHTASKLIIGTILTVIIVFAGICVGLLLGVAVGCIITTEPLAKEDLYFSEYDTKIYDSAGNVMLTLNSKTTDNSVWVDLEKIPFDLQHAFVAIEDERFYKHKGVDIKRTVSAVVGFVIPGMDSHGGSTITQQLVKNVTGDDSHSVPRKIREQWRAIQLEKLLGNKDSIMELYLNKIYFANNCYGVETAAEKYFGTDVSNLNLAQCAFIAGITNNPAKYNPATTNGRQNAYKRQVLILDNMLDQGYITREQYIDAIQTPLTFAIDSGTNKTSSTVVYTYFEDAVINSVRDDLIAKGYTKNQANNLIYNQGIQIYTTQDTKIQNIVNDVYCNDAYFKLNPGRDPEDCAQSAITVMDQKTGCVVAIYGGYGKKTQSLTYNRATDAKRQPGSSIKPILVYGPLIDKKIITAGTGFDEVAAKLDDQNPSRIWPSNWDNKIHGLMNARYALGMSYNIPAATWFKDNIKTCIESCAKMGIDKSDEPYVSIALGGFKNGVSPLQMCAAYAALANNGVYNKPVFYTKVYKQNGELLLDNTQRKGTQVYEHEETPSIITSMMESVVYDNRFTGRSAQIFYGDQKLPLAGKTGSTNDLKDYWFNGYTAYYTAAVWYGYDDSSLISESQEGGAAQILWKAVMSRIHKDLPIKDFEMNENLVPVEICQLSGKKATSICKSDSRASNGMVYTEYYIKGTEPTESCDCHRTVTICTKGKDSNGHYYLASSGCVYNGDTETITGIHRSDDKYYYILSCDAKYRPEDFKYELSHEHCPYCGSSGNEELDELLEELFGDEELIPEDSDKPDDVTPDETSGQTPSETSPQDIIDPEPTDDNAAPPAN